jgi:hypothetical protein
MPLSHLPQLLDRTSGRQVALPPVQLQVQLLVAAVATRGPSLSPWALVLELRQPARLFRRQ